jgi:hypothetical protein
VDFSERFGLVDGPATPTPTVRAPTPEPTLTTVPAGTSQYAVVWLPGVILGR